MDAIEEIGFSQGCEVDESRVERKYENVTLLVDVDVEPGGKVMKIFDTSDFERNGIIGFYQLLPKELFDRLGGEPIREALIPGCTVYKMKDGRWLWRVDRDEF